MMVGRLVFALGKRGMIDLIRTIPMSIADLLDEWFEHDALKGALSTLGVLNVQHGPQSGGTALVFLHNHVGLPVGHIGARRLSRGGVGALPAALTEALTPGSGQSVDPGVRRIILQQNETKPAERAALDVFPRHPHLAVTNRRPVVEEVIVVR